MFLRLEASCFSLLTPPCPPPPSCVRFPAGEGASPRPHSRGIRCILWVASVVNLQRSRCRERRELTRGPKAARRVCGARDPVAAGRSSNSARPRRPLLPRFPCRLWSARVLCKTGPACAPAPRHPRLLLARAPRAARRRHREQMDGGCWRPRSLPALSRLAREGGRRGRQCAPAEHCAGLSRGRFGAGTAVES